MVLMNKVALPAHTYIGIVTGVIHQLDVLRNRTNGLREVPTFIGTNPVSKHLTQKRKVGRETRPGTIWHGLYNYQKGNFFRFLGHSTLPNCEIHLIKVMKDQHHGPYLQYVVKTLRDIPANTPLNIDRNIEYFKMGRDITTEHFLPIGI